MRNLVYQMQKNTVNVKLDDNMIYIKVQEKSFFARYPVRIEDADQYLIDLMIWITFFGFGENRKEVFRGSTLDLPVMIPDTPMATDNDKILIEYSGGVDSTAAWLLSPEDKRVPVNCYRFYDPVYGFNQDRVIKAVGGLYIVTDFELIRELYIKDRGYNIGIGYIAPCFPLINILKIKYITLGVVWDDNAFWYGEPFTYNLNCSKTQTESVGEILSMFGIEMTYLTAGLSEVWTSRIVNDSPLKDLACSCHSEIMETNICGHCWKCFRKLGFIGQQLDFTSKKIKDYVYYVLKQKPLKMAASCVYGIQHAGYDLPEFKRYMDVDVSFCERYNDPFMKRWNTPEMYEMMIEKFKEPGIEAQTEQDHQNILKFVDFINNDKIYELLP